jgi:hypothetical protein
LPAAAIDWVLTARHADSTRYHRYAQTRGEEDFRRLSDSVAGLLNQALLTNDRKQTREAAERARAMLAEWPGAHYGYRQADVRELVAFFDEVVSDLQAAEGGTAFNVEFVAKAPNIVGEPLATMPSLRDQVEQAFRVAKLTNSPTDRVAVLQAALVLLAEEGSALPSADVAALRRQAESTIREEQRIDIRYDAFARRTMAAAARGVAAARVGDVERLFIRIPREDARFGRRRPEIVQALNAAVRAQLSAARQLRLLRDQWRIRVALYRDYRRSVGSQLAQLTKLQPALEAIRRLDGPTPDLLVALSANLRGGGERLARARPPMDLRPAHDLLLGAWRFAEAAVQGRYEAARAANVATAWEASSAAAGALLLFSRAQKEIQSLLEPPTLQ